MKEVGPSGSDSTKLERGARILREAILSGHLRPGQQLKQRELADQLGMSLTPIREVLRLLESEGLLEHIPYKGVFVAEVSLQEVEEIVPIRAVLEQMAAELGVPRLTSQEIETLERLAKAMEEALAQKKFAQIRQLNYDFHRTINQASGSATLVKMIERLWPVFATTILWMIPGRAERSVQQHFEILEAIKERDTMRATTLIAEHSRSSGKAIVEFLRDQPGEMFPAASPSPVVER